MSQRAFCSLHCSQTSGGRQWPAIVSAEFKRFCKQQGILHTLSPPCHPKSNGQVEQFVQSFKQAIQKGMTAPRATHDELVTDFLAVYRNTIHTMTGNSSAILLLNRDLRCQFNLLLPSTLTILDSKLQDRVRVSQ